VRDGFGGDADPAVRDGRDHGLRAVRPLQQLRSDPEGTAIGHGVAGVDDEVEEDLLELPRVRGHEAAGRSVLLQQGDVGVLDLTGGQGESRIDGVLEARGSAPGLVGADEIHQVPCDVRASIGATQGAVHQLLVGIWGALLCGQMGATADDSQDVVELVRHARGQLPHGRHTLGLLCFLPLRDIPQYTPEPHHPPLVVAHDRRADLAS